MKKFVYRPADAKEFVYTIIKNIVHKVSCVHPVIHKAVSVRYIKKYCTKTTIGLIKEINHENSF